MSKQKSIGLALIGALALTSLLLTVTSAWARPDERGLAAPLVPDTVVSDTISYQGQLLDSSGDPVDGTQVMTFSLYAGAGYTTPFWSQSGSVAVNDGLFNVNLDVNPLLFDGKALWLGVQVEGDTQEMTPRQPLLPAPYALSLRPGAVVSGAVNRPVLSLVNTGSSHALWGGGDSTYAAIYGENSGTGVGVRGESDTGFGVFGFSDGNHGVHAESIGAAAGFFSSTNGIGVQANTRSTDPNDGAVVAENEGSGHGGVFFSANGYGVYGESTSSINAAGYFTSADSIGVQANTRSADPNDGAIVAANDGSGHGGVFFSASGYGVYGESTSSINAAGYFTSADSIGIQANTRSADPNDGAVVAANDGSGHGGVFFSTSGYGVYGESTSSINAAGYFTSADSIGVQANTRSADPNDGAVVAANDGSGHGGVFFSASGYGVYGESSSSINAAGYFTSADSIGVQANTRSADPNDGAVVAANDGSGHGGVFFSANGYGVYGESSSSINAAGYFTSTDSIGVQANTRSADPNDGAVVAANDGSGHGGVFFSANGHGIYVGEAGGDYIRAGSNADPDFRVANDGTVYTDRGYNCGNSITGTLTGGAISEGDLEAGPCMTDDSPADFAEMLAASGDPAPGDVLVINTEGRLVPSTIPYAVNVVGVHSTKPSYLGGGDKFGQEGYVPLAIVGLVPVKASAENGPITPGDLLVSSATPGHAMKAGRNPLVGTVIGKALERLDTGTGIIVMLVVLQ